MDENPYQSPQAVDYSPRQRRGLGIGGRLTLVGGALLGGIGMGALPAFNDRLGLLSAAGGVSLLLCLVGSWAFDSRRSHG